MAATAHIIVNQRPSHYVFTHIISIYLEGQEREKCIKENKAAHVAANGLDFDAGVSEYEATKRRRKVCHDGKITLKIICHLNEWKPNFKSYFLPSLWNDEWWEFFFLFLFQSNEVPEQHTLKSLLFSELIRCMEKMGMGDTSDCYKIGRMYVCCTIKLFDKATNISHAEHTPQRLCNYLNAISQIATTYNTENEKLQKPRCSLPLSFAFLRELRIESETKNTVEAKHFHKQKILFVVSFHFEWDN